MVDARDQRPSEALTPREAIERAAVDDAFDQATVRILVLEDSQVANPRKTVYVPSVTMKG